MFYAWTYLTLNLHLNGEHVYFSVHTPKMGYGHAFPPQSNVMRILHAVDCVYSKQPSMHGSRTYARINFFFRGDGYRGKFLYSIFRGSKAKNILDNITVKIHCKWSSQGLRLLDPCMDKLIDLVIKKQNFLLNLNFISFCKCIYLLPCLLSFKKNKCVAFKGKYLMRYSEKNLFWIISLTWCFTACFVVWKKNISGK